MLLKPMKMLRYVTVFAVLVSCAKKEEAQVKVDTVVKKTAVATKDETPKDDDCVFDNDPKQLTLQWFQDAAIENAIWDEKKRKAIAVIGQDTLIANKGGCSHLISSLEIRMPKQYDDLFDSRQMQKINDMACRFKFDYYCGKLKMSEYDKIESAGEGYLLEFETEDAPENLVIDGVEIKPVGNVIQVKMSEYYN